jgi:serine/threonine protein kinase
MLRTLAFLAEKGTIHRDIKPEYILYDASMNFYISGFGISKKQNDGLAPIGTMSYMAPEMFCQLSQTQEADVFSLGLVILRILKLLPKCPLSTIFDPYKEWHDHIRAIASESISEISPMLSEESDDR